MIRRAAAVCLGNPDDALVARLPLVAAATRELPPAHVPAAVTFEAFIAHLAPQDPYELATDHVATFDQRNRNSLCLTWWTAGDTRNRGTELVGLLEAYRAAGMTYGGEELPDHSPSYSNSPPRASPVPAKPPRTCSAPTATHSPACTPRSPRRARRTHRSSTSYSPPPPEPPPAPPHKPVTIPLPLPDRPAFGDLGR